MVPTRLECLMSCTGGEIVGYVAGRRGDSEVGDTGQNDSTCR
jgi:hypothetical protein